MIVVVYVLCGLFGAALFVGWAFTSAARQNARVAAGLPARKAHPEARYAARTAERAGIFWLVFRALNRIFGR